jgi:hypothetical protein
MVVSVDNKFIRAVDDIDALLATRVPKWLPTGIKFPRPVQSFPPVILTDNDFVGGERIPIPEDIPPDLFSKINICVMMAATKIRPAVLTWAFTPDHRIRSVVRYPSKHMICVAESTWEPGVRPKLMYHSYSFIGGKWRNSMGSGLIDTPRGKLDLGSPESQKNDDDSVRLILGLTFGLRYDYSMVLRERPDRMAVRMHAPVHVLRYLLKTRDAGNEHRRKALLHLVRNHTRTTKSKSFDIPEHLRGAHYCRWLGLDVNVYPSDYDAERFQSGTVMQRILSDTRHNMPVEDDDHQTQHH